MSDSTKRQLYYAMGQRDADDNVVACPDSDTAPWLKLSPLNALSDHGLARMRNVQYEMLRALAAFMSGRGQRPDWLNEMVRIDESTGYLQHYDAYFYICGPYRDEPRITDAADPSPEASDRRARLMDELTLLRR